jgi:pimeloyl-ACP methyl ester carboxylesterase
MARSGGACEEFRVEAAGTGEPAIVLLPGALGRAELLSPALEMLGARRRTLALSYPPRLFHPEAMAEGIESILDEQRIGRAHLAGFSLGAQVARAVARQLPSRVASLVLIGAGAPDRARGERIARALPLLRWLPGFVLRRRWRRELEALLAGSTADLVAARARVAGVLASMSRAELVATRARQCALDRGADAPLPTPDSIPLLRLDLERDEVVPESERARLAEIEPRAKLESLAAATHAATLTLPPELLDRIDAWCRRLL